MSDENNNEYEWNALRKIWHLTGCLLMIAVFYLWKDLYRPVKGYDVLVGLGWSLTAIAFSIDVMRFYSTRLNAAVRRLPFYGNLMRAVEHNHFNATTYYLFAATILITACRFGWCRESTFVMALAVLGVADPAAAWTRYQLARRRIGHEREAGLLAFFLASFLVLWFVSECLACHLHPKYILAIGLIVAVVESYTKYWVHMLQPVTCRVQRVLLHRATLWVLRLYPDDNLLIPLMVALLVGILSLMP